MPRDFTEVLQQAMEFYVAGQLVEARALLLDIVRADPSIEAGWMFLSYTLEDPKQKADCLRKVMALNPQNTEAKAALAELAKTFKTGPVASTPAPAPAARSASPVQPKPTPAVPDSAVPSTQAPNPTPAAEPVPEPSLPPAPVVEPTPSSASAPSGQKPPSPKPSVPTSELPHTSPFTVDIEHANDEIPAVSEAEGPQVAAPSAAGAASAPLPPDWFPKPSDETPAEAPADQKPRTAPSTERPASSKTPSSAPSPATAVGGKPSPARAAGAVKAGGKAAPTTVRKTGQLASATKTKRKTGELGAPATTRRKTGQLERATATAQDQPEAKPAKRRSTGCTCLIAGAAVVLVIAAIGAVLWMTGNLPANPFTGGQPTDASNPPVLADTPTPWSLPPRSTETPTPTTSLTPTISPTQTYTPTLTIAPPDPTVQADMDRVRMEVEDIRGLQMGGDVPAYVVDREQAENILQADMDRIHYQEMINIQAKALATLGFIKPTYDLAKWATTRLADGVLGFYLPSTREVYVIGNRFAGMERYTFSHEYDHALVHHAYPDSMAEYGDPLCTNDSQRCEAIRALVEGDAMLVMELWREQYATAYDERDIALSPNQFLMPPEQNTPDYMYPSMLFTYIGGMLFVQALWDQGDWALVNEAFENLPYSTEQILHVEKYIAGEKPVTMNIPDLAEAVGPDWTLIKSDNLGEYMTYLLLAYGADNPAQLDNETAGEAANGWGGDHYLVYESVDGVLLLAAEWTWDTYADATQYLAAIEDHLDKRFRGGTVEGSAGKCWEMNGTSTCVYRSGSSVLWALGPEMALLDDVRFAYKIY